MNLERHSFLGPLPLLVGGTVILSVGMRWLAILPTWHGVGRILQEPFYPPAPTTAVTESPPEGDSLIALRRERRELEARLAALKPRGSYLVVDRANNRIFLRKGSLVVVDAPVSTGSGTTLKETGGQKRSWTFDTPQGQFTVLAKRADPVWTRPDWAFLEEGEPIPSRLSDRREYGSLGEYALDLGEGYMIHGTLYERLLGRSVTHGCVRVGREPLRVIASYTRVGTPVFIY